MADNVRPAYLDIEEVKPGVLKVLWKVPLNQKLPVRMGPSFPEYFNLSSPISRVRTTDAIIEKWTMTRGKEGFPGATVSVKGLEETSMEVLVRVQRADGSLHRAVLRPTETSTTIPAAVFGDGQGEEIEEGLVRLAKRWPYGVVFLAAWGLSLGAGARRRGLIICAVALIAGSLSGHALGNHVIRDNLSGYRAPSQTETKRILQGLMLNTYRAFMLDKDEVIYDVLARSVDGDFLSEVYLQNREAMRIDTTEGAVSIIDRLDIKSIESMKRLKGGAIAIVANWDVYGSVRHQNHIHYRCNAYKAELTIVPSGDFWKLIHVQLLDETRVI